MGVYDAIALVMIVFVVTTLVAFVLWLASLPGKIARERGHDQADAVNIAGWLSLLTLFTTWPFVMIWAYFRPIAVRMADGELVSPPTKGGTA